MKVRSRISSLTCEVLGQNRSTRLWLVASHAGWLISCVLAYQSGSYLWALAALAIIATSSLYHTFGYLTFEIIDTTYALIYMLTGIFLLQSAQASMVEWLLAIITVLAAFSIYSMSSKRRISHQCDSYFTWHAFWHISASFVTTTIYAIHFGYVSF